MYWNDTMVNPRNLPVLYFQTQTLSLSVTSGKIPDRTCPVCFCFPVVPHWRTEGALGEPGGDRRHSHAAGLPAPAAGRDTPPGGETEVQQRAGEQGLAYTRSACQAQLHCLARRSDLNIYYFRQKQKHSWLLRASKKQSASYLYLSPSVLISPPPPAPQVLSSGRCKTSWAADRCHETTTTRRAASQTGVAWAPLLQNLSTKQERPLLHSWREPSPQRSRTQRHATQTISSTWQNSSVLLTC